MNGIARAIRNLIRIGVVTDVDLSRGLCRVQTGGMKTTWLNWLTCRAGRSRVWWAPSEGEQVLRGETAYIGVIGSRRKTAAVNERLRAAGIPESAIARVHAPIGTAIRAVTPAEIAVSVAGEMICVRAERRGDEGHGCPMH